MMEKAFRPAAVTSLRYDGAAGAARAPRYVPVEVPVNLVYGGLPHVVLMASPANLEDLALGFSLTEGIIEHPSELRGYRQRQEGRGILLEIELAGPALTRLLARRRAMAGRTGCGLCGVEDLDQLDLASRVEGGASIDNTAIARALHALEALQPMNSRTHAVHAAGWFAQDGTPVLVREDVGRHNALDKMIGAALATGADPRAGFVVITSRCSYEMVEKTALFGAATLVAISAPTSLAIERAQALGVRLVGVAREDGALEFVESPEDPA